MPVQLGAKGQPGFDQPLELMSDCHRRIEHFLGVIRRAVDERSQDALDEQTAAALRAAQRYFREGAPRHTEDEEHSLFPRLWALGRQDADELLKEAQRLEREHEEAQRLHARVDERIERWLSRSRLVEEDADPMQGELDALERLYVRHIEFEDHTLFPAAARMLDAEALKRIGEEMAARRGLPVEPGAD